MEKFTRPTGLVLLGIAILLFLSLTSCTTDTESDVLYERATHSVNSDAASEKKDDPDVDKDLIDKRKIKRRKKTNG